jgi:hypothetical protein
MIGCVCVTVAFASNLATVWVPNYVVYVNLRFVAAVVNVGYFNAAMVLSIGSTHMHTHTHERDLLIYELNLLQN